jgi:copper homeostasis protein
VASAVLLEVCVDSVESARAAEQGGAQRVELCSNLAEGGVTPSAGMIAMTRKQIAIKLHVLIRPRSGDFFYSADEFEVIKRDILLAKQLGANGVALGVLEADAKIDTMRTGELVMLARPMEVTFHRAFDVTLYGTRDLLAALDDVISTGADRILTSGGAPTAEQGAAILARLQQAAKERIGIIAAGSIRANNLRGILRQTGIREIHAALHSPIPSPVPSREEASPLGTHADNVGRRHVVLPETVASLMAAAQSTIV